MRASRGSLRSVADKAGTSRRGLLEVLAVVGGVAGCSAVVIPATRFLIAPAAGGAGEGRWIRTVRLDVLREGEPKRVAIVADHHDAWTLEKNVELGAAWLVRTGDSVRAWSTVCPHLGCAVDRSQSQPGFNCPCHDSSFDPDGRRLNGPSPRDLDALETRIDDGFVLIEFRRFRQGTPEKVSVG